MADSTNSQDLSNIDVVVLALYSLGGERKPVDTEDIAIRASELAPGRFTWRKYPEQVSLEHVRVFLSDAKKTKNGERVNGDGSHGWHLTAAGASWATRHRSRLESVLEERVRFAPRMKQRLQLERSRVQELPAWKNFSEGRPVSRREAEAVFRVSDYVQGARRRLLIDRVTNLLQLDEELEPFIREMAKRASNASEVLDD